jgi:hypothetical protein
MEEIPILLLRKKQMLPDIRKYVRQDILNELGIGDNFPTDECKILVITGANSSGKSFLRRLWRLVGLPEGKEKEGKYFIASLSQEARSTSDISRAFVYGDESWEATGLVTYNGIAGVLNNIKNNKDWTTPCILVLDEPEIGMSREMKYSVAQKILREVKPWPKNLAGIVVLTHSHTIVSNLMTHKDARFYNLGNTYSTHTDWLNREIKEVNLETITKESREKFRRITKMLEKVKKVRSKPKSSKL